MKRDRVIILGGGLCGLAVADELGAAGVPGLVLEAAPQPGGLAGGFSDGGYRFDYGPHRFHTPDPVTRDYFLGLFADGEYLTPRRKSEIQLVGKRFAYPLELGDVVRNLDLVDNARAFLDYLVSFARNRLAAPAENSFEDWVVNRFGRTLYDLYFGPYTAKLWGLHPSRISLDWAAQRISLVNLFDVLKRLLSPGREDEPRTYAREFLYPKAGIAELPRRLAARAVERGAEVRCDARVIAVSAQDDGFSVTVRKADGSSYVETAGALVSTLPLAELLEGLEPRPAASVLTAARGLTSRAVVFGHLGFAGRTPSDNHWIYFPEAEYSFNRISEPVNFAPSLTPPGRAALTVEVSCAVGDEHWNREREGLIGTAVGGLRRADLLAVRPERSWLTRQPHAYPVYDIGYEERLTACLKAANAHPALVTTGRQGLFRYGNMDHALIMGRKAALVVLGRLDRAAAQAVGTQSEYFG